MNRCKRTAKLHNIRQALTQDVRKDSLSTKQMWNLAQDRASRAINEALTYAKGKTLGLRRLAYVVGA